MTVRIPGGAEALRRAGFAARRLSRQIAEVRGTRDLLLGLSALPGVIAIEERRLLYPTMDLAGPVVGAPAARAESGLDGRGVLVGVIDTGIDFRHADLRAASGQTRVEALLDMSQTDDGRHPGLAPPGRLWLRSEIDAALAAEAAGQTPAVPVTQKDTNGHGTHVAAIAASNGLATARDLPAGRYVGIAPAADLLIAQATRGGNTFVEGDVLAACGFLRDHALRLGRPLVLNLSLGGVGGPHDGTSNLELALDELFPGDAAGHALVVAAGNEGSLDLHAGAWSLDGEHLVPLEAGRSMAMDGAITVEIWYAGDLSISVESPGGTRSAWVAAGSSGATEMTAEGRVSIENASGGPRARDGRRQAGLAIVGPPGGSPAGGVWKIRLKGRAARYDLWVLDSPPGAPFAHFTDRIAVDGKLALPATALNAISVGAFVSRNEWVTVDGGPILRKITVGTPSSFSATGPTSDGRFAPDVIAPGEFIIAALSAEASPDLPGSAFHVPGAPTFAWADDGLHGVLRGTSQAAPQVAGALALLLQREPTLTATELRERLRASARDDGRGFSIRAGFGKLDVAAAARYAGGLRGELASPDASSVGVSRDALPPGGEQFRVSVTPRDGAGALLGPGHTVDIRSSAGAAAGPVVDAGAGRYERAFVAAAPRGTVARITAVVDGVTLSAHPEVHIVLDRSEIGRPFVASGGCASGGAPVGVPLAALALVALLGALVARARRARAARRRW